MYPRRLMSGSTSSAPQASPTVYLEKGSYRMRAPGSRPGPLDFSSKNTQPAPPSRPSNTLSCRMAMLVAILLLACLGSFSVAYYLFKTRWSNPTYTSRPSADASQVIAPPYASKDHDPHEKYLSYLPHSGFHNQRIAFENALTLASLLNRTLIVPPIRLGNEPIRYYNFNALSNALALSGKEGLEHCARIPEHVALPAECFEYHQYTFLPWTWLVNLSPQYKLIHRLDMSSRWIRDHLKLKDTQIYSLKDTKPYQFRFLDVAEDSARPNPKYDTIIRIEELAQKEHRLIQLGTLFGTSRLRLVQREHYNIRGSIRRSMVFSPHPLRDVTSQIVTSLPSLYLAAHIRIGDGWFMSIAEENARLVWWRLLYGVLHFSIDETLALESLIQVPPDRNLHIPRGVSSLKPIAESLPSPLDPSISRLSCRSPRHTAPHLSILNTPLYVATDAKDPANDPMLSLFMKTFPCIFFLGDFSNSLEALNPLRNGYDDIALKPFLVPFVDAMVASHGWKVVGTEGSTYSRFMEDVLWPTYHEKDITQKG